MISDLSESLIWRNQNFNAKKQSFPFRHPIVAKFLFTKLVFSSLFFLPILFSIFTFLPAFAETSITVTTDDSIVLNMPGRGSTAIASSDINVVTNCKAGYTLTMSATSSDNNLYLDGDTSHQSQENYFIAPSDGTTILKNSPNTWGYLLTDPAPTENSVFLPVPTNISAPATLKTPAETASTTNIDDTFSIYFGVSLSPSIAQGLYRMPPATGQTSSGFSFLALTDPSCDIINLDVSFDANAGTDPVSDLPSSSDVVISGNTATLPSNTPTRTGYSFLEWNTASDGTGNFFHPGDIITIGTGPGEYTGTLPLFAIWIADCPTTNICYHGNHADAGTMNNQTLVDNATVALTPSNFSRAGFGFVGWSTNPNAQPGSSDTIYGPNQNFTIPSSGPGVNLYAIWLAPIGTLQTWANPDGLNVGDVIALRDDRDDQVYTVAKLADNNVWITENLRLIPDSNVEITTQNTNSPTSGFLEGYPSSSPSTMCSDDNATCDDSVQYNTNNINRGLTPSYNTNDNTSSWYSYGVMYNWYTATAGNGLYNRSSGSVSGDLCPAGWHLPTGGSSGEWGALNNAVNGGATKSDVGLRTYPVSMIRSGDYNSKEGGGTGRGTQGRIWSATAASGVNAYRMGYSASDASATAKSWNKWDGFAIRCIYQGGNIPYADVDVVFSGTGIESLTFTNTSQPTVTATPSDPSISLAENTLYAVTATTTSGYEVASWTTTTGGTLGDSITTNPAVNPNTYILTDDATLTVTGQVIPSYTVTATIPEHVTNISFADPTTSPATVITIDPSSPDCTDNGDNTYTCEVDLKRGIEYTLSATFEPGYTLTTWTTGTGGILGNPTSITTTYTITSATTLTLSTEETDVSVFTLNYDAVSGTDAPESETKSSYNVSEDFTITNSAPINYGYTFLGWSETSGATTPTYVSGDTYTITSTGATTSKTLYAVYQANNCPANKICYYDNGADVTGGGRGTMNNQSTSSSTSANLIPSNYSKTGYGFAGWSTVTSDTNNNNAIIPSTTYGPNATITTPDTSTSGLALYAKWVKSEGNLQDWRGCNAMNQGSVIALTDTRDNQTYAVAKLADDNCWTIENLRLDPGTADITASNTHSPTSTFITQSDAGGGSSLSTNTMCNSSDDADNCINQIQYNANSLDRSLTPSHNTASSDVYWYSYGVYYNWYTATAGNGTYSMDPNVDVGGDICPSNWHLPTGNTTGEYNTLNTAINNGATNTDAAWRNYPNNFIWSGDYNNNKRTSGYSNGRLWTATTKDNPTAYRIGYKSNEVTSRTNSFNKWDGFIVRCIKDETAAAYHDVTVTLPQNVSSIVFTNAKYGTETATTSDPTVSLAENATYTITANIVIGYELDEWTAGQNATIGSTTQNPTTIIITDDSTLTLSVNQIPSYQVTVNFTEGVSSIGFYNPDYGTYQVTTTGSTVTLYNNVPYTISSSYTFGYTIDHWSTTGNGTLASTTSKATTYTVTGIATLNLTSKVLTPQPVVTNPGYISYNPNASGVTDSMGDQSITASQTTADLWASNFQRPGYGFAGWSDSPDWQLNENDANGNGISSNAGYHIYGPNETISFTAGQYSGSNPGLSLYAVWVPSEGNLQGWTGCSNLNTGQITALTDTRDNQVYTVAKLGDNKCWTVENLRLDNEYTTSSENIAKAQGYNSSFIGLADPETAHFSINDTTANSLYSTNGSTSAPTITGDNQANCFPRYNNQNTANPATNMTAYDNNTNVYSLGNYYTWAAAIASTSDYNSGTHNTTSICPTGWHIPTGGANGEYKTLNTRQNSGLTNSSAGLRAYPANFIYSGRFSGSSADDRSMYGNYWSSTAYNYSHSYFLFFYNSTVWPADGSNSKYTGQSIRCSL